MNDHEMPWLLPKHSPTEPQRMKTLLLPVLLPVLLTGLLPVLLPVLLPGLLPVLLPGLLPVLLPVLLPGLLPGLLTVLLPVLLTGLLPVLLPVLPWLLPGLLPGMLNALKSERYALTHLRKINMDASELQSMGGLARARSLTPARRKEIALKAGLARWAGCSKKQIQSRTKANIRAMTRARIAKAKERRNEH
jgi:hypothetical protein